jgi:hypothetical protein
MILEQRLDLGIILVTERLTKVGQDLLRNE